MSLLAVNFVWLRLLWIVLGRSNAQKLQRERHIFHSQLGVYMASLLVSNLLSSVSYIMNAGWLTMGFITPGELIATTFSRLTSRVRDTHEVFIDFFCTFQGGADTGTALYFVSELLNVLQLL